MTEQTNVTPVRSGGLKADFIFGGLLAVVFAIALILTFDWPAKAAMFPRVVTGTGLAMSVAFLLNVVVKWRRERAPGYVARTHLSVEERAMDHIHHDDVGAGEDAEQELPEDVEYVFATAGRSAWLQALGWVVVFRC